MAFPDTVKCPISFIIKYVIECFFPIFYYEKLVSLLFYENFFGSSWFGLPVPQFYFCLQYGTYCWRSSLGQAKLVSSVRRRHTAQPAKLRLPGKYAGSSAQKNIIPHYHNAFSRRALKENNDYVQPYKSSTQLRVARVWYLYLLAGACE